MTSGKSKQSGNTGSSLKDFAFFCIPMAVLLCILGYVQIVVISGLDVSTVNFILPALLGFGIGTLFVVIKQLGQMLSKKMVTDPLTGTLNRSWLKSTGNELLETCQKEGKLLSIMLFNIDHFQQFNTVNGYQAGDNALRQMAQIVTRSLRGSDLLVRWAGEEFVILLPDTPSSGAMTIAERLRKIIASYSFAEDSLVTCSFGIAQLKPEESETLEQFLNRARTGMLNAKQAGRNQVQNADNSQTASAENPSLDRLEVGARMEINMVSTTSMYKHALSFLAPEYAKRLMIRSLAISIIVFPLLALLKFKFIDGVSLGFQHAFIPLLVAFAIGFLSGKIRIMNKAIQTQDIMDPLTRAYNRHWLEGYGRQQVQLSRRYGHPLSLALIEVDNLEHINNKFGTASGDLVLQKIADTINESCEESSALIRWSGKIFMLFMPGVSSQKSLEIAEKIHLAVGNIKALKEGQITCSIGLTCFIKDEDTEMHHLIDRANTAMLQALEQGKNCVKVG